MTPQQPPKVTSYPVGGKVTSYPTTSKGGPKASGPLPAEPGKGK